VNKRHLLISVIIFMLVQRRGDFIRPPDIGLLVGGLRFYRDSFFLHYFRQLPASSLNGTQPKPAMLGSECDLKMHVRNLGHTLPLKAGAQTQRFLTISSQLGGNFNGWPISSAWNTIYTTRQMSWKLQGVSYIVSKPHKLWSTNGLKLDRSLPPPRKSCIPLHCQALQMEISKRNSTKRCQKADGKSRKFAVEKSGSSLPKIVGKKLTLAWSLDDFET